MSSKSQFSAEVQVNPLTHYVRTAVRGGDASPITTYAIHVHIHTQLERMLRKLDQKIKAPSFNSSSVHFFM